MIINKAFKVRIYPNKEQINLINQTLGSCRALFNMMLFERKEVYEKLKNNKRLLYEHKYKTEKDYKKEYEWMRSVDSISLQQARIDLSNAYSNFFKSLSGKIKSKSKFPKFKRKKDKRSYRTVSTNNNIKVDFDNNIIILPKIGGIKYRDKRYNFKGIIKSATVSLTPTGKYFVSILFEQEIETKDLILNKIPKAKVLGLDMSLNNFFVDNNGNSPVFEKLFRNTQPKLKKFQRRASKKVLGSKNWYKSIQKVNLIHEKISNKRKDFTHKLSTNLIRNYDVIVVEYLNLKGISQCLNLGKSLMDLGYSEFIRQLDYKSVWNSKLLVKADKWFASSKLCSVCGYKYSELQLSEREWKCPNCGINHNRDTNAGNNLKQFGLKFLGLDKSEVKPMEFKTSGSEVILNKSLNDEVGSPNL